MGPCISDLIDSTLSQPNSCPYPSTITHVVDICSFYQPNIYLPLRNGYLPRLQPEIKSQASGYNCSGKISLREGLKYFIKQFTGKYPLHVLQLIESTFYLPYSFPTSKIPHTLPELYLNSLVLVL